MSWRRIQPCLLVAALAGACGGKSAEPPPVALITCPIPGAVTAPTFTSHIWPALQASCGKDSTSCHGAATPPTGHVRFDTSALDVHGNLVGQAPSAAPTGVGWLRVAAGDAAHSWIVEKITKDAPGGSTSTFGARMPLAAPNVCAATVQAITDWINRGAPL